MAQSRAIVTIVHNEAFFLPIWRRYYGQFFAPEDMYVFDHQSTDGSTDDVDFNVERVTHEGVDHRWMRNTIQARQHELLERYDIVLINDVDEIVAPNPRLGTLGDYIDTFDADFINCTGYELLHQPQTEGPYDPTRPILRQRGHWFPNYAYSKPLLARVPMKWHIGFHARKDGLAEFDKDLHLIHLHRMDYETCRARHRRRVALGWAEQDRTEGWAYQNRLTGGPAFDEWFFEDSCTGIPIDLQTIPPEWSDVV
jgi:hypothetical protein